MIKKTNYTAIIALTLFFSSVVFVSMFNSGFAFGANLTSDSFRVVVNVSGNPGPNITAIAFASSLPVDGGIRYVYIYFNVTDDSGETDIDETTANITFSRGGVSLSTATACQEYVPWTNGASNQKGINCSVPIEYYRDSGFWNVSGYIEDNGGKNDTDINASSFRYDFYNGFRLETAQINFTGAPGASGFGADNDPLLLNNTGNVPFTGINITAYKLNHTSGDEIGPGNFTVNITDGWGQTLEAETSITGASLGVSGTEELYFFMNIPGGIEQGIYNSTQDWQIEVFN